MTNRYEGIQFLSTTNVATSYAHTSGGQVGWGGSTSFGFMAAHGPFSGWGDKPMEFTFTDAVQHFGFYHAGPKSDMTVTVTFDGGKTQTFDVQNHARRATDSDFFGVRATGIKHVIVSGSGYAIDDLRWA